MFLLDTNVISELRKADDGRADAGVVKWASQIPRDSLFTSAIVLMEIEIGIRLKERKDTAQGFILRQWMDEHVVPFFDQRTVPIDTAVAMQCAELHVPDKRPERDALIAATAFVHGMALVTRNEKDFEGLDIKIINPWSSTIR